MDGLKEMVSRKEGRMDGIHNEKEFQVHNWELRVGA